MDDLVNFIYNPYGGRQGSPSTARSRPRRQRGGGAPRQSNRRASRGMQMGEWDSHTAAQAKANMDARAQDIWNATVYANENMGPSPVDPFNGANLWDLLGFPADNGGGGGGGGGRGGGAGGSGSKMDPAQAQAAYKAMLSALVSKGAADMSGFDQRVKSVNDLAASGEAKLKGILAGLAQSGAATRGQVAQSYAGANRELERLGRSVAAEEAARAAAGGRTLAAFGAAPTDFARQYGAKDLVNAQRAALLGMRAADDRMFAQRGDVYGGLGTDARLAASDQQNVLLQQIAAARQQAKAQADAEQAKLKFDASLEGVLL